MNFKSIVLAILSGVSFAAHGQSLYLPETDHPRIEYKTVAEALAALSVKSGAESRVQDGWIIISERESNILWSFAPAGHPAYPAVVKRKVFQRADQVFIGMDVLCQAEKKSCDELVQTFQRMNKQMREKMQSAAHS